MYIAIEGVIGVGKTTLARLLQNTFDAEILLEVFRGEPLSLRFLQRPRALRIPNADILFVEPLSSAAAHRERNDLDWQEPLRRLHICQGCSFCTHQSQRGRTRHVLQSA